MADKSIRDDFQFLLDQNANQRKEILDEWEGKTESEEKDAAYEQFNLLLGLARITIFDAKRHGFVLGEPETGKHFYRHILEEEE